MKSKLHRWFQRMNLAITTDSIWWRRGTLAVIGVFVILSLTHALLVPAFEGSDEQRHYAYARYLLNERSIPPRPTEKQQEYYTYQVAQQAGQPPLYYLAVALITAPVPGADNVDAFVRPNWFRSASDDHGIPYDNHRYFLHGPEDDFPWQGAALAVRLARLFSVLMGALTLVGVHGIARSVMPNRPDVALLATAFFGLIPRNIALSATVTNDVPVTLFATFAMWTAFRIVRAGPSMRLAVLGGVLAALTTLSKFNGMWVVGALAIAIVGSALLRRKETALWQALPLLAIFIGIWLALSGWWFVYGYLQDGDPLGVTLHTDMTGQGILSVLRIDWELLNIANLKRWELSTWYSVAWSQINGPEGFYLLFRVLYMGGLGGALLAGSIALARLYRARRMDGVMLLNAFLLLFALVCIIVLAVLWQSTGRNRLGRYLYPGLTTVATAIAFGWVWLFSQLQRLRLPNKMKWVYAIGFGMVLLGSAGWGTYNTLRNLLPHPLIRPVSADVSQTQLLFLRPDDKTTLVAAITGYRVYPADLRPGNALYVDVCWKSYGYTAGYYPYTLQLVGPNDMRPGTRNSYHGLGSYPMFNWHTDDEFCDPTSMLIGFSDDRPRAYNLYVSLFELADADLISGPPLPAVDGEGRPTYPAIGRVRVAPETMPVVTPTISLGNLAGFVDWHAALSSTNTLSVTVRWVALQPTERNIKVFFHVTDASGAMVAQDDHEPDGGWFPTPYWQPGDVISDTFTVAIPSGIKMEDVVFRLGMYDADSLERLPAVRIADGERLLDDMIVLTR